MMHNLGNEDNKSHHNVNHQRKMSNSLNGIDQRHHQRADNSFIDNVHASENAHAPPIDSEAAAKETFPNGGNYVEPDYDDRQQHHEVGGVNDDDDDAMPPPPPPPPIWDDEETGVMIGLVCLFNRRKIKRFF